MLTLSLSHSPLFNVLKSETENVFPLILNCSSGVSNFCARTGTRYFNVCFKSTLCSCSCAFVYLFNHMCAVFEYIMIFFLIYKQRSSSFSHCSWKKYINPCIINQWCIFKDFNLRTFSTFSFQLKCIGKLQDFVFVILNSDWNTPDILLSTKVFYASHD